jgi:hypothetical protein
MGRAALERIKDLGGWKQYGDAVECAYRLATQNQGQSVEKRPIYS